VNDVQERGASHDTTFLTRCVVLTRLRQGRRVRDSDILRSFAFSLHAPRLQAASCWGVTGVSSTDVGAQRLYKQLLTYLNSPHSRRNPVPLFVERLRKVPSVLWPTVGLALVFILPTLEGPSSV